MIIFQKVFVFMKKAGSLDRKEIKLNSNPIWMTGTVWFILKSHAWAVFL